jgi:hypothetical protein
MRRYGRVSVPLRDEVKTSDCRDPSHHSLTPKHKLPTGWSDHLFAWSSSNAELHKIPARVHCTVQVCRIHWRTCTPHHTVAGRSSISLTQSPFPFPSATAAVHPLSAICRAVPLHPYALVDRSSVSLTQSPFPFPFATATAHPLSATCRAVPLHHLHACRLSCTHLRTLCDVHGLCTSGLYSSTSIMRTNSMKQIRSKSLWRWYINTIIDFLDIIYRPVFSFKNDVSETTLSSSWGKSLLPEDGDSPFFETSF